MRNLPDKPSALIDVAMRDLEAVEKDRRYRVNMNIWHHPWSASGVCDVCLAGAVIACTLKQSRFHSIHLGSRIDAIENEYGIPRRTAIKLQALNDFRLGNVVDGLARLGLRSRMRGRHHTAYEADRARFKSEMAKLRDDLARVGL